MYSLTEEKNYIEIESIVDAGSIFTVSIPLQPMSSL
jgi:hypothetical protein